MDREENCGCGGHHGDRPEGHGEDCGCGGHEHHGGCRCGCHQFHGDTRFHRRFISREEIAVKLEEYLKQLQAEAKGVEERIAELKKGQE